MFLQVLYQETEERQRARVIKDPPLKRVMKSLIRGSHSSAVAKTIMMVPSLQTELVQCLVKILDKECNALCSQKRQTSFRSGELENLNLREIIQDLELRAPTLLSVLKGTTKTDQAAPVAVCSALLLKNRNKQIARIPHVIAQILDHGGATDEVY